MRIEWEDPNNNEKGVFQSQVLVCTREETHWEKLLGGISFNEPRAYGPLRISWGLREEDDDIFISPIHCNVLFQEQKKWRTGPKYIFVPEVSSGKLCIANDLLKTGNVMKELRKLVDRETLLLPGPTTPDAERLQKELKIRLFAPPHSIVMAMANKVTQYNIWRNAGFPVEEAFIGFTYEEARNYVSSVNYDLIIRRAMGGGGGYNVTWLNRHSLDKLKKIDFSNEDPFLIQRFYRNKIYSPNVQLIGFPNRTVFFEISNQILQHEIEHIGNETLQLPPHIRQRCVKLAIWAVEILRNYFGYKKTCGFYNVDTVVKPDGEVIVNEVNVREAGSSLLYFAPQIFGKNYHYYLRNYKTNTPFELSFSILKECKLLATPTSVNNKVMPISGGGGRITLLFILNKPSDLNRIRVQLYRKCCRLNLLENFGE